MCIPTSSVWGFPFLHILANMCSFWWQVWDDISLWLWFVFLFGFSCMHLLVFLSYCFFFFLILSMVYIRKKEKPRGFSTVFFLGTVYLLSSLRALLWFFCIKSPGLIIVYGRGNRKMYIYSIFLKVDVQALIVYKCRMWKCLTSQNSQVEKNHFQKPIRLLQQMLNTYLTNW